MTRVLRDLKNFVTGDPWLLPWSVELLWGGSSLPPLTEEKPDWIPRRNTLVTCVSLTAGWLFLLSLFPNTFREFKLNSCSCLPLSDVLGQHSGCCSYLCKPVPCTSQPFESSEQLWQSVWLAVLTVSLHGPGNICDSAYVCFLLSWSCGQRKDYWGSRSKLTDCERGTWSPSELLHHPSSCFVLSSLLLMTVCLSGKLSATGSSKIKPAVLAAFEVMTYRIVGGKRPLRSSPTIRPTPPCLLNHILKCHIYTVFKHLQGWWRNHLPGQPIPMSDQYAPGVGYHCFKPYGFNAFAEGISLMQ